MNINEKVKNRLMRTAFFALVAFFVGGLVTVMEIQKEGAAVSVQKESRIEPMAGAAQVGGDFALVNQDGAAVTNADYPGYKLIYFGFTYCPAVCPTELQRISAVLKELGTEGDTIQPLFITVDPERDTVTVMKDYVALFHPRMAGLTGNREQIDATLKSYKVFARKVQDPELSDYTMDHSSFIYLMSPDDRLITMYRAEDTIEFITGDIKSRLASG